MSQITYRFPTGSIYTGQYDEIRGCMEGFGTYFYPDGSSYRGHFKDGHFHGYGLLHLATPYKFSFTGQFENDCLVQMEDMFFEDGLRVIGTFDGYVLDILEWRYCDGIDRRYSTELPQGPEPVDKISRITRELPPRHLNADCYDTGDGIYHKNSGFILSRPPPFAKSVYIGCNDDIKYIEENCRRGKLRIKTGLFPDYKNTSKRIIDKNIYENPSMTSRRIAFQSKNPLKLHTDLEDILKKSIGIDTSTSIDDVHINKRVDEPSIEVETDSTCFDEEYKEVIDKYKWKAAEEEEEEERQASKSSHCQCLSEETQVSVSCSTEDLLPISTASSSSQQSIDIDHFIENAEKYFHKDWMTPLKEKKKEQVGDPQNLIRSGHGSLYSTRSLFSEELQRAPEDPRNTIRNTIRLTDEKIQAEFNK